MDYIEFGKMNEIILKKGRIANNSLILGFIAN